jgi:hypothetical protein
MNGKTILVAVLGSLLFAALALTETKVEGASVHSSSSRSPGYGFIVDGGHLYVPYLYYRWTDRNGRFVGMRESLETASANDGYVMHRCPFTGSHSGRSLKVTFVGRGCALTADEALRFTGGVLYVKESQTGAVWWAKGRAASESQWARRAIRFMECYTNPYDAGNPSRKCSNVDWQHRTEALRSGEG